MKIALVSPYDYGYPGGVISHISNLAVELHNKGNEVKILAPYSSSSGSPDQDVLIPLGRPVPVPSGGSIARISLSVWQDTTIKKLLAKENFDIVHIHEPLTPFLPLAVLRLSNSIKVGTFHAFNSKAPLYWMGRHLWVANKMVRTWFDRLDGRIAVSKPALDFVSQHFPADYKIIPNGINMGHFSQPKPPIPWMDDGFINILFVGRLEKRKGLKHLLRAYGRLKWRWPKIRLIVVGPGRLDKDCTRVLGERVMDNVVFVGHVSQEDLPRYHQSAHIFCAPNTGEESFGIILLEAMAAGLPVVATAIEGFRSIMTDGKEGLLVPPQDESSLEQALERLIIDVNLRQDMSVKAYAKAEQYDWKIVAGEVMRYYQSLITMRQAGNY